MAKNSLCLNFSHVGHTSVFHLISPSESAKVQGRFVCFMRKWNNIRLGFVNSITEEV